MFTYKYILMEEGQMLRWEAGIDRIAELSLIKNNGLLTARVGEDLNSGYRHVSINDVWE